MSYIKSFKSFDILKKHIQENEFNRVCILGGVGSGRTTMLLGFANSTSEVLTDELPVPCFGDVDSVENEVDKQIKDNKVHAVLLDVNRADIVDKYKKCIDKLSKSGKFFCVTGCTGASTDSSEYINKNYEFLCKYFDVVVLAHRWVSDYKLQVLT